MSDFICQGCGQRINIAYQCSLCKRILCSVCSSSGSTCKDKKKGIAGCNGYYQQLT